MTRRQNRFNQFQSTLSVRRATEGRCCPETSYRFQSTLSVRRATITPRDVHVDDGISIHALRKESDVQWALTYSTRWIFQSTLSVRRATYARMMVKHGQYFNPRSP